MTITTFCNINPHPTLHSGLLALLLSVAISVFAEDAQKAIARQDSLHLDFRAALWQNPALMSKSQQPSLSQLLFSYRTTPATQAKIPQLGNGETALTFSAKTFQSLSGKDAVWGNASYENGKRRDVVWNETSDFLLLFPYVLADPIGGDMQHEQYTLNGGYTLQLKQHLIGAELGYRALSEYRMRDPRPNNTTAYLYGKLGYGRQLLKHHIVAASVALGKYKQTNELAFLNELGAEREYHLTGIGNDFTRFSGASNNAFYKGHSINLSLEWLSLTEKGFSASVGYESNMIDKILSDLNYLPLNRLQLSTFRSELTWKTATYGFRLVSKHSGRDGNDNLFGDASSNVYPQIGTRKQYKHTSHEVALSGFYETKVNQTWQIYVEPQTKWTTFESRHYDSDNQLSVSHLAFGTRLRTTMQQPSGRLYAELSYLHRSALSHQLQLNKVADQKRTSEKKNLTETFQHIDAYLGNTETQTKLTIGYDFTIWQNKAITAALSWQHDRYLTTAHQNSLSATIGIAL